MSEDIKIDEQNSKANSPAKEKSKKEKADNVYRLYKKETHKDNKCILNGVDDATLIEFNKGGVITVSNEQIKIIGCEVNEQGDIISLPYRWLGVE